jgi:hypothetical protein
MDHGWRKLILFCFIVLLAALAFAEIFASVLAGAILAGIWEWDRDRDGIADHKQRPKTTITPGHTVEGLERMAAGQLEELISFGLFDDLERCDGRAIQA